MLTLFLCSFFALSYQARQYCAQRWMVSTIWGKSAETESLISSWKKRSSELGLGLGLGFVLALVC